MTVESPDDGENLSLIFWPLFAAIAIAVPVLIAYNVPPSSTFINQAASVIGWGGFIALLSLGVRFQVRSLDAGVKAVLAAFAVLVLSAMASMVFNELPASLAMSAAGLVLVAGAAVIAGHSAGAGGLAEKAFTAICIALTVAGVLSASVGLLQVFVPDATGNDWIAATAYAGRASGNVRQPNHLSSLLSLSVAATAWLAHQRPRRVWVACAGAVMALLVLVMALSASRTGWLCLGMLAGWGALDNRLAKPVRGLLLAAPVMYVVSWAGLTAWAHGTHQVFGGEARLSAGSSSRFPIWRDTLQLILDHPLAGVGFGQFNFAWSLTPFPTRPVAFFDHTHNILLQFLVELGIPLALVVLGLFGFGLWSLGKAALRKDANSGLACVCAVMLAMMVVHSLLEYPLWYAYFLLPASFIFGLGLSLTSSQPEGGALATPRSILLMAVGLLIVAVGAGSLYDYSRVVRIFSGDSDVSLQERITAGQKSVFFAYQADYAAVTTATHPGQASGALRASHNLLDTRLMIAWAKAYAERGDLVRARHLVARLKEFHNEDAKDFFDECNDKALQPAPFQCTPGGRVLRYEDFLGKNGG